MVKEITGSYIIPYSADEGCEPVMIDFTPPWKRIPMMAGLEEALNVKFPPLDSPEMAPFLEAQCKLHNVECRPPRTVSRLIDKLVGHFLEENIINPTFLTDHPEMMSPLAKAHRSSPGLTERFELFVCKRELCNAYTELNNPITQRQRFARQAQDSAQGDDEAQVILLESLTFYCYHFCVSALLIVAYDDGYTQHKNNNYNIYHIIFGRLALRNNLLVPTGSCSRRHLRHSKTGVAD
jgi:lysyl-tRNA synthetase class II